MDDAQEQLDPAEIELFLATLAFVREYGINVISATPGRVAIELPFDERFSGPPGQFPASMVGTAGDVAAVSSCLSLLPRGWALATLDFTIKMTGVAKGEKLRARGRPAAPIRSALPMSISCRQSGKRCAGRCWPRPAIFKSGHRRELQEEGGVSAKLVMPGLVPGIHVLTALQQERRGWPGQARP